MLYHLFSKCGFPLSRNLSRDGLVARQRAKKVVSDSPGLVGFAIGQVNSVVHLSDGKVKFFEEFKLQMNCKINSAHQKVFGAS